MCIYIYIYIYIHSLIFVSKATCACVYTLVLSKMVSYHVSPVFSKIYTEEYIYIYKVSKVSDHSRG